jgi:hypothetical protein
VQAQLEKEKADTILELQTLEASKTMMSERMAQANLQAKRSNEKVEGLKTQVGSWVGGSVGWLAGRLICSSKTDM